MASIVRMQQEILTEMIEMLSTGIVVADSKGWVRYANSAALRFMDLTREKIADLNIEKLINSIDAHKETILKTREGRRIPVRMKVVTLSNSDRMISIKNITEIHQLQQELLKMDRLATVGELTSGIAHEIRNPLAGIKTTAQALSGELPGGDHRRDYVDRIIKEIDRLNKLLLNFFDFAKPRALNIRKSDLKKVILDAVYMIRDTAAKNQVQVIEFYPAGTLQLNADPDMIKQVLMNILLNGIQSMDGGGKLEIVLAEKDDGAEIRVRDTGKGIPENLRGRIFDPFFTTKAKGIGLGLSISYRIIRMHSGNITFDTSPQGTVFILTLPKGLKVTGGA